jgi:hypothetical protein
VTIIVFSVILSGVRRIALFRFGLHIEHGHGADRRAGAVAPLHRQADEGELAGAEQRFQIAQALDVGDIEFETRLVNQQIHLAFRAGPHTV